MSPTSRELIPVQRGKQNIPRGTVHAILRDARITRAQALKFWGIE